MKVQFSKVIEFESVVIFIAWSKKLNVSSSKTSSISNLLKKGDYGSMLSEIGILQQEILVHLKKIRHDQ